MGATESIVKLIAEASVTSLPGIGSAIEFIAGFGDPGRRAAIEAATTAWVLEELPRHRRLIEQRAAEIAAAGCSAEEVMALASQTMEAQRRAFYGHKRRALTNVLVNGLCVKERESARHRLYLRLTSELEAEHIAILGTYVGPVSGALSPSTRDHVDLRHSDTGRALARELIARGLLFEDMNIELDAAEPARRGRPQAAPKVKTKVATDVTWLGRDFLEHLRDPDRPAARPRHRGPLRKVGTPPRST